MIAKDRNPKESRTFDLAKFTQLMLVMALFSSTSLARADESSTKMNKLEMGAGVSVVGGTAFLRNQMDGPIRGLQGKVSQLHDELYYAESGRPGVTYGEVGSQLRMSARADEVDRLQRKIKSLEGTSGSEPVIASLRSRIQTIGEEATKERELVEAQKKAGLGLRSVNELNGLLAHSQKDLTKLSRRYVGTYLGTAAGAAMVFDGVKKTIVASGETDGENVSMEAAPSHAAAASAQ